MTIREELEKLIDLEEISKYLTSSEKKYIIKLFKENEKKLEKEYEFENKKDRLAIVILYNLVSTKIELRSRKIKDSKKLVFSFENLSRINGVSEKTLSNKNRSFISKFGELIDEIANRNIGEENDMPNKLVDNLLKNIKKYRRKTDNKEISNKAMMNMFITTFENVKAFYQDKNAIKIKEYLVHMQANMIIAGYNVDDTKLEQVFCEFSKYLGFELTDGRNKDDFVKVKDAYGKYDNRVYIEFRR